MPGDDHNGHTSRPTKAPAGRPDIEQKQLHTKSPLMRSPLRAMIQDFSPIWFTWVMNSGIIAILLHQHPYQFTGIRVLSAIAFVVALLLFFAFSLCLILRLVIFRSQAYQEITNDTAQLPLLGCWAIGYLTLPPSVTLLVSESYWGGYWSTMLSYVMWWFGAAWTFSTLFFIFSILSRRHLIGGDSADATKHNIHKTPMPTLVIIPAVGVATVAVTGVEIVQFASHMDARLAVPVIIIAFPLLGLGMLLATLLYAILFHQLLETGFPPPAQITSLFVYIGPFGQSASALQGIGASARLWFGSYNSGTFITEASAQAVDAACTLGALLLLGPAAFFTIFSIYALIDCAVTTKEVRWSPSWNAIIFPTATMTTATTYLSQGLDSPTFRVLTSIQLVALVAVYFVNLFFTLMGIWKGQLLIVREDPRVKKQLEDEQKGK